MPVLSGGCICLPVLSGGFICLPVVSGCSDPRREVPCAARCRNREDMHNGMKYLEAREENHYIHELRYICNAEGKAVPAPAQDRRVSRRDPCLEENDEESREFLGVLAGFFQQVNSCYKTLL